MIASIIVLNYQGEKIISKTIDSLLKLNFPRKDYEIIVVDNNSQDRSKEIINKYSKYIKTVFLPTNLGFGEGNNQAIKTVNSKYIALLNNDCIVEPNWLTELVKTANKYPKAFSITSKIKKYPESLNLIQNAGSIIFQDGYGRDIGAIVTKSRQQNYESDANQFDQVQEIYSSCGAAVLYNKKVLDKIGLFDNNFFMYYEDTEISERAYLCGYHNYYCPKAVVYHHHAVSSKEWSAFFIYNVEKGRLLHVLYHFPLIIFLQQYFLFSLKSKLRFMKSLVKQNDVLKNWQYLKVSLYFFLNFPRLILKRYSYSRLYSPKKRDFLYQQILSGYWYFN